MRPPLLWIVLLVGCAGASVQKIKISPHTDLNAVSVIRTFADLKNEYTVRRVLSYGPRPEMVGRSLALSREGINYEVPDRKVIYSATLWDLPLIKSNLREKFPNPRSRAAEEMRRQMLADHRSFTQFLIDVESHVENYFEWDDAAIWLEDAKGKAYFPVRTHETSDEEPVLPVEQDVLGKPTKRPGYTIYHRRGRLSFKRLALETLSPVRIVLMDKDGLNRVEFPFVVKGRTPSFSDHTPEPPPVDAMRLHFNQATAHFKMKDYEKAIEEWRRVLALDPDHELSKKKIEKARALLDEELMKKVEVSDRQKKRQMQVHFLLATEHFKAGEIEAAVREWERVLEYDPDHALSKEKIEKARAVMGGAVYEE